MAYKIIGDSCTDLTIDLKNRMHVQIVPLSIHVDDEIIFDDETFNQEEFLSKMEKSSNCPKSSCPSPDTYMKLYEGDEDVYVVTLSSNLSGSYNSAELAKKLYLDENPNKNIAIIDSKNASVGQTLIVKKIYEYAEEGKKFHEIVKLVEQYRDGQKTKFVLENLDTLRKNGRLNSLQAIIVSALNIKPVMGSTPEGTICKVGQSRGIQKALSLMAKFIEEDAGNVKDKTLGIAHCNNFERANYVKDEILKRLPFKDFLIVNTGGISTMYANRGGVIVSY
mgnify:CR=1 FL=1